MAPRLGGIARVAVVPKHLQTKASAASSSAANAYVPHHGTYPKGFELAAINVGVKPNSTKLDLALIKSEPLAHAGAVYTTNAFQAAPVQVSKLVQEHSGGARISGIVANSGCANAVTGKQGIEDAKWMSQTADELCGNRHPHSEYPRTLVMSTGVIGVNLPMEKLRKQFTHLKRHLAAGHESWMNVAKAFMTTDTFPKLVSREVQVNGHTYAIAGIGKGAGMIHPNMATLLSFIATDAPLDAKVAQDMAKYAADRSFNCITIDGDTSTNDTFALLANGAAGGPEIAHGSEQTDAYTTIRDAVTDVAQQLAQLITRDGEGATKFITIDVANAETQEQATTVAKTIATSSLVKTAMYGQDANWGRILCAIGYSGVPLDPHKVSVAFVPSDESPEMVLVKHGEPQHVDEDRASQILAFSDLGIRVDLGSSGAASSRVWTCDLSKEYISINADYRPKRVNSSFPDPL